jgi:D-alanyl-D-alanine dipeptidase
MQYRGGTPIPQLQSVGGWKEIPIRECGSELVPIGPFSDYGDIFSDAVYYGEYSDSPYVGRQALKGSLLTMFVRREVADRLRYVQAQLPAGRRLVVFDAYRSLDVQAALYQQYFDALHNVHRSWTDERLSAETQKMVSLPSTDPTKPSPHNSGGSVDVAIVQLCAKSDRQLAEIFLELGDHRTDLERKYNLELQRIAIMREATLPNFGTPFDHGGPSAQARHMEDLAERRALSRDEIDALNNRRQLFYAMTSSGFEAYPDEWWHFNAPESQMGARTAGLLDATYGAAELSVADLKHEQMRRAFFALGVASGIAMHRGATAGAPNHYVSIPARRWLSVGTLGGFCIRPQNKSHHRRRLWGSTVSNAQNPVIVR